jgi:hypothetical protein
MMMNLERNKKAAQMERLIIATENYFFIASLAASTAAVPASLVASTAAASASLTASLAESTAAVASLAASGAGVEAAGAGVSVLLHATTAKANNAANNSDFFMSNILLIS